MTCVMYSQTFRKTACLLLCVGVFALPHFADAQQRRRALSREEQLRKDEQLRQDQQKTVAQGTGFGAALGAVLGGARRRAYRGQG